MNRIEQARASIETGLKSHSVSPARIIAVGIMADLLDRSGIKSAILNCADAEREEILDSFQDIAEVVIGDHYV